MRMQRFAITVGLVGGALFATASAPSAVTAQAQTALPGSDLVDGQRLRPHSATWSQKVLQGDDWVLSANVTEELREKGADRWVRVQTTVQGPLTVIVEVEMEKATLRPISLRRRFDPMPPEAILGQLAAAGLANEVEIDFGATGYVVRSTLFSGETTEAHGDFGMPYFDGSVLGLVVAAADVEAGVRLPVLFLGNDGTVTEYWVDAVAGAKERLEGVGEATRVDVGWLDFESGVVTSEAGHDAAGGSYWIATDFDRAVAPVSRYKNESVDILIEGGAGGPSGSDR